MPSHQLIGSPISYYTGKVRAYLRYKDIPFQEVLSSRDVYKNIILPRVGVQIIPIFITDNDIVLQDSSVIIDYLERRYPVPSIISLTPLQRFIAFLFEVYGDEWLVIPAMHYRWNIPENKSDAFQQFGATSAPELSAEEQREIGEKRAAPFAGALPRLGVTERNAGAIERSYLQFLTDFNQHLAKHRYLLGDRPSIGDFGLIGPLYAHLYRDPASGRLMSEHAPRVAEWVQRVHNPQPNDIHSGDFLPDDEIPDTLLPLLQRIFTEQVPVLMNTIDSVAQWARDNPEDNDIPRMIGEHKFTVEGVEEVRGIFPNNQWMWQRPLDCYHNMTKGDRAAVNRLLLLLPNGVKALNKKIGQRLVQKNYRIVLDRNE